jgi:hypothetical protein
MALVNNDGPRLWTIATSSLPFGSLLPPPIVPIANSTSRNFGIETERHVLG